jgi:hypothetical protein
MDLNQLLHAHQIAKIYAAQAPSGAERAAHADTMAHLATRIRTTRAQAGADVDTAPFVAGEPIAAYRDR